MKKRSIPAIVFLDVENAWEKAYLRKRLPSEKVLIFLDSPTKAVEEKIKNTEILSVFIKSKINTQFLRSFPKLQFITTRSTGFDHIDLKACKKRGIVVSNVPVYGENTVAEHTFALILSLSRNLRKAYLRTVQNNFSIEGLMGFDLKGKTLGIVGTGYIGLHVIRMGIGFGMKVIAFDVKQNQFLAEVLGFEYVSFEDLLKNSDIISLHTPYLPATKHLINKESIKRIKKGAILINTARGGLIETDALVEALDRGVIAGAGLDVLENEEFILEEKRLISDQKNTKHWSKIKTVLKNHALLHRENVVYTPHMAFYSKEAVERILDTTVSNIKAFVGSASINQVNYDS